MDASRTLKNRRGQAIIYLALVLFVLIGFAALVIDLGYMYVSKSQLQNAADAGALAGASKLNGIFTNHTAHVYAREFTSKNKAAGEFVPVGDNRFYNYSGGDTVVGCWNETTKSFHSTPITGCPEANAVKVVARRTTEQSPGTSDQNKPVGIFLGRIFGEQWEKMSAKATAIAINQKANVSPIAVNEYWMASGVPGQQPYFPDQNYPNSFVRKTNLNGNPSPLFAKTFALMGARADRNGSTDNINGYVDLLYRTSENSSPVTWYLANNSSSTCPCTYNSVTINQGTINSNKYDATHLNYLFNGLPENILPPIPVIESLQTSYPPTIKTSPTPSSSACPYSTVAYFSSGGTGLPSAGNSSPLELSYSGKSFTQKFSKGKKIITIVYDGIPSTSDVNGVTVIGYSLIEIDGYSNNIPKKLFDSDFYNDTPSVLSTLYGHAVSDLLAPNGASCDLFMSMLNILRYQAGTPKLVK